jgi:hypothetical protein
VSRALVFRQRLDNEVEAQPQAPTVVIESHWKHQCHHEKQRQDAFILCPDNQQKEEANQQNYEFRRDHVRENRAYKKAVLTLKKRVAVRAVMPYVKWVCDDLRLTTCRTTQPQTPAQYLFYLVNICFQGVSHINAGRE